MGAPYALSSDLVSAWPAKSLEVAQYIDGQLPLIAMTQNAQTGTTYTLAATDFTKLVTLSNASPVTVTVPLESSVAWVAGTQLRLMNLGAGVVTVVGASGVTINGSPLTLSQYKNATLTKTGTNIWTFTGSASAPGMDLITPTSVAGSGVTLSGGVVSFSASTSISVNGCFTSAYDNYMLLFNVDTFAASSALTFRLRASGSDNATSDYSYAGFFNSGYSATLNGDGGSGQTSWAATTQASYGAIALNLQNPERAQRTFGSFFLAGGTNVANYGYRFGAATQFDGITFLSSQNATGTARIYGLRNS